MLSPRRQPEFSPRRQPEFSSRRQPGFSSRGVRLFDDVNCRISCISLFACTLWKGVLLLNRGSTSLLALTNQFFPARSYGKRLYILPKRGLQHRGRAVTLSAVSIFSFVSIPFVGSDVIFETVLFPSFI